MPTGNPIFPHTWQRETAEKTNADEVAVARRATAVTSHAAVQVPVPCGSEPSRPTHWPSASYGIVRMMCAISRSSWSCIDTSTTFGGTGDALLDARAAREVGDSATDL